MANRCAMIFFKNAMNHLPCAVSIVVYYQDVPWLKKAWPPLDHNTKTVGSNIKSRASFNI